MGRPDARALEPDGAQVKFSLLSSEFRFLGMRLAFS